MDKEQENGEVVRTDSEELGKEAPISEEPETENKIRSDEPEWYDEDEPEEWEESESSQGSEKSEEPEWYDEEEPEESEKPDEPEESGEPEWYDEDEPEESEKPDEPEESDEPEWYDEDEPEESGKPEEPEESEAPDESKKPEKSEAPEEPEWYDEEEELKAEFCNEENPSDTEEEEEPVPEKKKHRKWWITLIIVGAAILVLYLIGGFYYKSHFLPNTVVNGIDCSYMTVEELEDAIQSEIDEYELNILEREDETETISGVDFGLHVVYGNTLTNILDEQGAFKWPSAYFNETTYDPGKTMAWDEEKFQTVLDDLNCTDTDRMVDPKDAEIKYSSESGTYYIEPAVYGTHLEREKFDEAVKNAVYSFSSSVDLEREDCYQTPNVTEQSSKMVVACTKMNRMINTDITYDMGDIENIHIDKDTISGWIVLEDNLDVTYDEEAIAAYVADFADQYDTRGSEHSLVTTWGPTVSVSSGSYGWALDQEGEIAELESELEEGAVVEREPVWANHAASHGTPDYGSTYVEVNLTAQHLYFYKNGSLIVDSDFVSGRMTADRETPTGIYYVYYKQTDATLKGEDYETPVSYWMPFNGGVGLHDATWRSSFGGDIYVNSGSHGCINLPYSVAQTIYETIDTGDCVFVYQLEGTSGSAGSGGEEDSEE